MDQEKILGQIEMLQAQLELMAKHLTVLEQEVRGSSAPRTSPDKGKYIAMDAKKKMARRRARQMKKAANGGS